MFAGHSPCVTGTLPADALVLNPRGGGSAYVLNPCSSLSGVSCKSGSFFHHPNPHYILQPEVMGIYLLGARALGCVVWSGAGTTCFQGIPANFYPPHINVGPPVPLLPPLCSPPTCQDECGFFKSAVVGLLTAWLSDSSGCYFLRSSCNHSCGCTRRWSMFACASNLTGSLCISDY